jgi:predicted Zn-dependent protease
VSAGPRRARWVLAAWLAAGAAPLFAHGDLHEQIDALSAELEREPGRVDLLLRRAELHRLHQDWKASASDYDRAERLDPKSVTLHLGRGLLLADQDKLDGARKELDKAIATNPAHVDAHIARARVLAKQGKADAAADDYRAAIAGAARAEPEYYDEAAQVLAATGDAGREHALALLEEGLSKLGHPASLELRALDLEIALRRYDAALARVDRLAAAATRTEGWQERRGDIQRLAGREDEARLSYRAALDAIARLPARLATTHATVELRTRVEGKFAQPDPD